MKSWLAYTLCFGIGALTFAGGFRLAFAFVMSPASFRMSEAGVFLVILVLPLVAALLVFVAAYGQLAGHWIGMQNGLLAIAFMLVVTFVIFAPIVKDHLEEVPALIVAALTMYLGGRLMLTRAGHV